MIDVVITAWPNHPERLEYVRQTMLSMVSGLTASRHEVRYLCSAESHRDVNQQWCGDELGACCKQYDIELHWRDAPPSLGGNMNAALRLCTAPVRLLVQDDCPLILPLDLSPGAELLLTDPAVSLIRYDWPPGNRTTRRPYRALWQQFEFSGWFYGDRANMFCSNFTDRHGWYREGCEHGSSESGMADRLKADRAVILAPPQQHFEHIPSSVPSVLRDHRSFTEKR